MDDLPADDADAPIIVPKQTLQRAQRTKIRKPGLPGDGGGHRFAATRRGHRGQAIDAARPSSDMSSASDHGDEPHPRPGAPNNEIEEELARLSGTLVGARPTSDDPTTDGSGEQRTTSPAETAEDDDIASISSPPPSAFQIPATMHPRSRSPEDLYSPVPILHTKEQRPPISPSQVELPPSPYPPLPPNFSQSPILHHPQPKHHLDVPGAAPGTTRSPSPGGSGLSPPSSPEPVVRSASTPLPETTLSYPHPIQPSRQSFVPSATPTAPAARKEKDKHNYKEKEKEKEKEKKSGLFGWGGGKEKKKGDREKIAVLEKEREKEREGGGGFFGFFGGGKKKHEEHIGGGITHAAGREAAAALLGQSKGKAAGPLMGLIAPGGLPGQYARYPIHVERAIYRLSHIKLANPRRPLYEQVLISNLMFWYLGIVNKPAVPPGGEKPAQQPVTATGQPSDQTAMVESQSPAPTPTPNEGEEAQAEENEKEEREQQEEERLLAEQHEREMRERERAERERAERERLERERAAAAAAAAVEKEKTKKGGLTKAERAPQSAAKRAEMPVRGPGFDMQHQMIEQEYGQQQQQYARQQAAGRSGGPAPVVQPQTSYHLPQRIQLQNQTQQGPPPRPPRGDPPQNAPQQPYFYHQDANQVAYQPMTTYALPPGAKAPAHVENSWAINAASGATPSTTSQRQSGGASADGSLTGRSHSYKAQTHPPAAEYLQAPPGQKPGRSLSASAISSQSDRSNVRSSGAPPAPYHPQSMVQQQQHQRHNSQQPAQNALPPSAYGPPYSSTPVLSGSGGQPPRPSSSGRLVKKKSAGGAIVHSGSAGNMGKDRRKSLDPEPYRQRQNGAPNPEENFSLAMWQQYPVQQQQGHGKQQQLPNGQWGQQSYR